MSSDLGGIELVVGVRIRGKNPTFSGGMVKNIVHIICYIKHHHDRRGDTSNGSST